MPIYRLRCALRECNIKFTKSHTYDDLVNILTNHVNSIENGQDEKLDSNLSKEYFREDEEIPPLISNIESVPLRKRGGRKKKTILNGLDQKLEPAIFTEYFREDEDIPASSSNTESVPLRRGRPKKTIENGLDVATLPTENFHGDEDVPASTTDTESALLRKKEKGKKTENSTAPRGSKKKTEIPTASHFTYSLRSRDAIKLQNQNTTTLESQNAKSLQVKGTKKLQGSKKGAKTVRGRIVTKERNPIPEADIVKSPLLPTSRVVEIVPNPSIIAEGNVKMNSSHSTASQVDQLRLQDSGVSADSSDDYEGGTAEDDDNSQIVPDAEGVDPKTFEADDEEVSEGIEYHKPILASGADDVDGGASVDNSVSVESKTLLQSGSPLVTYERYYAEFNTAVKDVNPIFGQTHFSSSRTSTAISSEKQREAYQFVQKQINTQTASDSGDIDSKVPEGSSYLSEVASENINDESEGESSDEEQHAALEEQDIQDGDEMEVDDGQRSSSVSDAEGNTQSEDENGGEGESEYDERLDDEQSDSNKKSEAIIDLCDSDEENPQATDTVPLTENRIIAPEVNSQAAQLAAALPSQSTELSSLQPSQPRELAVPVPKPTAIDLEQSSQLTLTQPLPATVSTPVKAAIEVFMKLGARLVSAMVGEEAGEKLSAKEYELLNSILEKNKPVTEPTSAEVTGEKSVALTVVPEKKDAEVSVDDSILQGSVNDLIIPAWDSTTKPVIPRRSFEGGSWNSRNSFLPSPAPTPIPPPSASTSSSLAQAQKPTVSSLADILSRRKSVLTTAQADQTEGKNGQVPEIRKRTFQESILDAAINGDSYLDTVLYSASKKATVESSSRLLTTSALGSGILTELKPPSSAFNSSFSSRSSYIPVFKSNTARFGGNERTNPTRQSFAGQLAKDQTVSLQEQQSALRAPLSLSYVERRKLQRQSEGRDGVATVSKKILETLSGMNTPIESERSRPVAISWKDYTSSAGSKEEKKAEKKAEELQAMSSQKQIVDNSRLEQPQKKAKSEIVSDKKQETNEAFPAPMMEVQRSERNSSTSVEKKSSLFQMPDSSSSIFSQPAFPKLTQEEPVKKTVRFKSTDEEFVFEEPSDDFESPEVASTAATSTDQIKYVFSPPKNRRNARSNNQDKASICSECSGKDSAKCLKCSSQHSRQKDKGITSTDDKIADKTDPKTTPVVNIWATVPDDLIKCSVCMVRNPKNALKCSACESPLEQTTKPVNIWDTSKNDTVKCPSCMVQNKKTASKCVACETPLSIATPSIETPSFSTQKSASTSFSFEAPAKKAVDSANGSSGFIFGVSQPSSSGGSFTPAPSISFGVRNQPDEEKKDQKGFLFGVPAPPTSKPTEADSLESQQKTPSILPAAPISFGIPTTSSTAQSSLPSTPAFGSTSSAATAKFTFGAPKSDAFNSSFGSFSTAQNAASGGSVGGSSEEDKKQAPISFSVPSTTSFSVPSTTTFSFDKSNNKDNGKSNKEDFTSTATTVSSSLGTSRPLSSIAEEGPGDGEQALKRKSNRVGENDAAGTAGPAFFSTNNSGKQDESKTQLSFGALSSTAAGSSATGATGPFSVAAQKAVPFAFGGQAGAAPFPTIPAATTSSADSKPKLNFGGPPTNLSGPVFGGLTSTPSAAAQPFGSSFGSSSTAKGSSAQPMFGAAVNAASSSTATTSVPAALPTSAAPSTGSSLGIFGGSGFGGATKPAPSATPAFAAPTGAPFGGFGSTPAAASATGFGSVPSSTGTATFGQPTTTPTPSFTFGNTLSTSAGFPSTQSSSSFAFAGNDSPSVSMDMGESSNLSAPSATSTAPFGFGAGVTPATSTGPVFGANNPFGAIISQTQPATQQSSLSFGNTTAPSSGFGFGSSSSSNNLFTAQTQSQSIPFGAATGAPFGSMGNTFGSTSTPSFGSLGQQQPVAPGGVGAGGGFSLGSVDNKKTTSTAGRKFLKAKRPAH